MVAIDTNTGTPIRIGGAALASGPALTILTDRRNLVVGPVGGGGFPGIGLRRQQAPEAPQQAQPTPQFPVPQREVLPATWGVPAYFANAPFGPPYELPARTAEWELSAEAKKLFKDTDKSARMSNRVHPRGTDLKTSGVFLSALYGTVPAPNYLGVGLDAWF